MSANNEATTTNNSARAIVEHLLRETGLATLMDANTLVVSVGDGKWISYKFNLQSSVANPAHAFLQLRSATGNLKLRRCRTRAGAPLRFRSKGAPSAHFELLDNLQVEHATNVVRGHVDAADPWRHPINHLLRDYLPARGFGEHPTPEEIFSALGEL